MNIFKMLLGVVVLTMSCLMYIATKDDEVKNKNLGMLLLVVPQSIAGIILILNM